MKMLLILIPALLLGCREPKNNKAANSAVNNLLQQWLNEQPRHRYTLVFAMNANDCIPCMRIFSQFLRQQTMNNTDTVKLIALFDEVRSIERPAILSSVFQDADRSKVQIEWNSALYRDALAQVNEWKGVSALLIYDKTLELKFAQYGKLITGLEPELAAFVRKPDK